MLSNQRNGTAYCTEHGIIHAVTNGRSQTKEGTYYVISLTGGIHVSHSELERRMVAARV